MSCSTCGFDASAWTDSDLKRTLGHVLAPWFRQLVEGAGADVVAALAATEARLAALSRMDPDAEHMHEAWRLLGEAGRVRQSADRVSTTKGTVVQVNTSAGGVPK